MFVGIGIGIPCSAISQGGADPLKDFGFYDDYRGTVAALNGRMPPKGASHTTTGAAGAGMTAGGGVMKTAADGAGYDVVTNGFAPRKVVGEWLMTSGNFSTPATLAICKDTNLAPMLHGEGGATTFYMRLVGVGPVFLDPLFSLKTADWSALSLNTQYRDELHYDGAKRAAMVKRAPNGTILGQQLIYDFRMPDFVGNVTFWEALTSRLNFKLATAQDASDYAWPAMTELAGIANPTTAMFVATVFGGTVTNSGTGLTIAGGSYGQGGQDSIGAVTTSDRIQVSFDVTEKSGGQQEVALLKTGAGEAEKSNIVYFSANGRVVATLTPTENMVDASVAIAVSGANVAGSCKISNYQVIKNPPTAF